MKQQSSWTNVIFVQQIVQQMRILPFMDNSLKTKQELLLNKHNQAFHLIFPSLCKRTKVKNILCAYLVVN